MRRPLQKRGRWVLAAAVALACGPAWAGGDNIWQQRYQQESALQRVTTKYEGMIPASARRPDGTVDVSNPEYQKIEAEWRAQMDATRQQYNARDGRWDQTQQIIQERGLDGKIINTGSKPKGLRSDQDYTAKDYQSGKKFVDGMRDQGHDIVDMSDRWVDRTTDTTVWKPVRPEPTGSSAYDASMSFRAKPHSDAFSTEGGFYETTGGQIGTKDPAGAVLANINKASDAGLTGPAESMDLHTVGKSVSKAVDWSGRTDADPRVLEQASAVRNHKTPDEAGITRLGESPEVKQQKLQDFQRGATEELRRSYESAEQQSTELRTSNDAKARDALATGNRQEAIALREGNIRSEASNQSTWNQIAQKDPKMVESVRGVDPTTPQGKETMLGESQHAARELAKGSEEGPSAPVEGGGGRITLGGASRTALTGLWILNSGMSGAEQEMRDAIAEGREPSKVNAVVNGVLHATGIPGAWTEGTRLRDEELAKADAEYGDAHWGIEARLKAAGRFGAQISGWDSGSKIAQEEIEAEEKRAAAEGREPNYQASWANGTLRGLGEVLMINSIARSATHDWEADARWANQERTMRNWAAGKANEDIARINAIRDQIKDALTGDPNDPATQQRLEDLIGQYDAARGSLLDLGQRMRKQLGGAEDPLVSGIYGALKNIPPAPRSGNEAGGEEGEGAPESSGGTQVASSGGAAAGEGAKGDDGSQAGGGSGAGDAGSEVAGNGAAGGEGGGSAGSKGDAATGGGDEGEGGEVGGAEGGSGEETVTVQSGEGGEAGGETGGGVAGEGGEGGASGEAGGGGWSVGPSDTPGGPVDLARADTLQQAGQAGGPFNPTALGPVAGDDGGSIIVGGQVGGDTAGRESRTREQHTLQPGEHEGRPEGSMGTGQVKDPFDTLGDTVNQIGDAVHGVNETIHEAGHVRDAVRDFGKPPSHHGPSQGGGAGTAPGTTVAQAPAGTSGGGGGGGGSGGDDGNGADDGNGGGGGGDANGGGGTGDGGDTVVVTQSGTADAGASSGATANGSGGYAAAPQDRVIDGSSQIGGRTVTGVKVTLDYDAYGIPDQFQIVYGSVLADSGNTSGSGQLKGNAAGSSPKVTIRVITKDTSTAWEWSARVEYSVK